MHTDSLQVCRLRWCSASGSFDGLEESTHTVGLLFGLARCCTLLTLLYGLIEVHADGLNCVSTLAGSGWELRQVCVLHSLLEVLFDLKVELVCSRLVHLRGRWKVCCSFLIYSYYFFHLVLTTMDTVVVSFPMPVSQITYPYHTHPISTSHIHVPYPHPISITHPTTYQDTSSVETATQDTHSQDLRTSIVAMTA